MHEGFVCSRAYSAAKLSFKSKRIFSPEREGDLLKESDLQTSQSSHSFMAMKKEKKNFFFVQPILQS